MPKRSVRWQKALALIILFASVLTSAWADGRLSRNAVDAKKICYCGCDSKLGTPMCTMMCELPKYENRSWAKSCKRAKQSVHAPTSKITPTHSNKRNRTENARL